MPFSRLAARIGYYRGRLPHYLAFRAGPAMTLLWFRRALRESVPRLQDAPILIYTMGRVGTTSLEYSLRGQGMYFTHKLHLMRPPWTGLPHQTWRERRLYAELNLLARLRYRPLRREPRLRVVTMVRDPIARLLSIYLYRYRERFGRSPATTDLATLVARFPAVYEELAADFIVPGEFFKREFEGELGLDVFAQPFARERGWTAIEQGNVSLLVLKLETPDATKEAACRAWLGRDFHLTSRNTAAENAYDAVYQEFKRRVRIPRIYAERIYGSPFMRHFYTAEERAALWRRWEPQLDATLSVPPRIEARLARYHPPGDGD